MSSFAELRQQLRAYHAKSRYVSENYRPWVRARVKWEFMRRNAHISWPFYGPILPALREGRLEVGRSVTLLPGCWITAPADARVKIGRNTFLNMHVTIAAYERVEIGAYCMLANGCFVTDADHRFDDPVVPVYEQGYHLKGPTTIGDHVWCGVNVAVLAGVKVGDHCVIGANSVVTHDLEPFSIAAGAPAKVLRRITYEQRRPA